MLTLHERRGQRNVCTMKIGAERRQYRRHDLEHRGLEVFRFDGNRRGNPNQLGVLVDLSAGGVRIRTGDRTIRPDTHVRVRLELPEYAGISAFVQAEGEDMRPRREWVGWMTVRRVIEREDGQVELAGPLEDMTETDRGMLGLYLSTQPMAA